MTPCNPSITDLEELRRMLDLPDTVGVVPAPELPLLVPRRFVRLMKRGDPNDPLLRQVLPEAEESNAVDGFSEDPLAEFSGGAGVPLLQKYPGRALLMTSSCCGIHCRFCFRRFFPRSEPPDFETVLEPVRNDPAIEELILSGGDPLTLTDEKLQRLVYYIVKMPHVKRIRLHSRLPIVRPDRITPRLLQILDSERPVYLVLHVNHPNELDEEVFTALASLRKAGLSLLSQTVLLKGINDDEETLYRLFSVLADHRVLPYYLHQLDKVRGAAHFEVDPQIGRQLIARLRDRLPGYAVPRYVRETIGSCCKQDMG